MTIYETNRRRWDADRLEAGRDWIQRRQYKRAVRFVMNDVPDMLKQMDADTETIQRKSEQIDALRRALHAAGGDPGAVLREPEQQGLTL